MGGNYVQTVVNRTALDILEGRNDLVLVTGGESWRSRTDARKTSTDLGWTVEDESVPDALPFSPDQDLVSPDEIARGIFMPVQVYPMFENALRAADGLTLAEQRDRTAGLWSRFSEVAATNPNAWIQRAYTPDEIATATPDNRMIGFPYTKLEN